ncbi:MAG: zinc ribbon-containing protein [Gammaproteobacteria bacterium]|jgi:hypothetical protein|nr:zinc ribbon-containing protein [Gammaproteobacteria bacterium]
MTEKMTTSAGKKAAKAKTTKAAKSGAKAEKSTESDQATGTAGASSEQEASELSAYDRLMEQTKVHLQAVATAMEPEQLKKTIDKAAAEVRELGEHSREAIGKASAALKKDLASTSSHFKAGMDEVGKGAAHMKDSGAQVWTHMAWGTASAWEATRDWGANFTGGFLKGVSDWSSRMSAELEKSLVYHTGEMTYGGSFRCVACDAKVSLEKPGHLPACPACKATDFRRA